MSYKVKIELDFDTYKPNAEDIYKYIKDLYPEYITSINTRKNGNTSLRFKKIKGKYEDVK